MKKGFVLFAMLSTIVVINAQPDSLNMRFVGNWPFGPSYAVAADTVRELAFLGSGGGVYVLDISDLEDPQRVSDAIRTRGMVNGLFYDIPSNCLYIAGGDKGFEVWDVSNPGLPEKKWQLEIPGEANRVWVSYPYVYLVSGGAGLSVIRLNNTAPPSRIGYYNTPGYAYDVAVKDSFVYVADGDSGVCVVNVSNPFNPYPVRFLDFRDQVRGLCIKDTYLYVADGDSGLSILDISNPVEPSETGRCYLWDIFGVKKAYHVCVSDSFAFMLARDDDWGSERVWVVNVTDPASPMQAGVQNFVKSHHLDEICVLGNRVGVAQDHGFEILKYSNYSLFEESFYYVPGFADMVKVTGKTAYVQSGYGFNNRLYVLDITDPTSVKEIGSHPTENIYGADDSYPYLYLARGCDGFAVIDVSNSSSIEEIGAYDEPECTYIDVVISNGYAYVVDKYKGLSIFDVQDPFNPRKVGSCGDNLEYGYVGVYVKGDYAYLPEWGRGLRVIDVSEPSQPRAVGFLEMIGGWEYDITGLGSEVYIADWYNGLRVVDVSDKENPSMVWSQDTIGAIKLNVSNPYLFACNWYSTRIFDITDPSNPGEVGYYQAHDWSVDACSRGRFVYVAEGPYGLQIYENLLWEGIEEGPEVAGEFYLTTSLNQLSYDVPGETVLSLYSVDGRLIHREPVTGSGIVEFSELSQGVYFAQLRSKTGSKMGKLVILR